MTVFDLLAQAGAEHTRIGGRHRCPECGARTGLAVRNDSYARCFACHKVWNTNTVHSSWLSAALTRLAEDCLRAAHAKTPEAESWKNYLLNIRRVDQQVLSESPVGMVPADYNTGDVRRLAKELFEQRQTAVSADATEKQKARFEAKLAAEAAEFAAFNKQLTAVGSCGGWIAFFYGFPGRYTSVKLREVAGKDFRLVGNASSLGVFNPISPDEGYPDWFLEIDERLPTGAGDCFVFEGEFNALTFLSQTARAERAKGREYLSVPCCAMGAAGNWDTKALAKLTEEPVICCDNDDAGKQAVINLARDLKKPIAYFMAGNDDMDSYLRNLEPAAVMPAIEAAWSSVRLQIRSIEDVREELNVLRQNRPDSDGNKRDRVTEIDPEVIKIIWRDLNDRGKVYHDTNGEAYFFHNSEKRVYTIGNEVAWDSFLSQYGLLSNDKLSKQVTRSTVERASREGEPVVLHQNSYYDSDKHTCYLDLGGHKVARITASDIRELENGDDGVLFVGSDMKQAVQIDFANLPTLSHGLRANDTLLTRMFSGKFATDQTHLTPEGCRQMILARLLLHVLADYSDVRPLLIFKGEAGSGKTMMVNKFGWLFEGERFLAEGADDDPREMETKLISSHILALDNVDDLGIRASIDLICRAVTGGAVSRRKLYADANKKLTFPLRANVYVSTRTNPFDRPDVASRQILIPLTKFDGHDGRGETELKKSFLSCRNEMMAKLVVRVQKVIVALQAQSNVSHPTNFRLRDFANLCLKVADHEGWKEEMEAILEGTGSDQEVVASEDNLLLEVMKLFIGLRAATLQKKEIRLSATELRAELLRVFSELRIDCPWKTPAQLAHTLKREPSMLRKLGVTMQMDKKAKPTGTSSSRTTQCSQRPLRKRSAACTILGRSMMHRNCRS